MLVLVTLFISVANSLPRTSYVKMIDIWFIMNLMVPFVEIILETVFNKVYNEKDVRGNGAAFIRVAPTRNQRSGWQFNGLEPFFSHFSEANFSVARI